MRYDEGQSALLVAVNHCLMRFLTYLRIAADSGKEPGPRSPSIVLLDSDIVNSPGVPQTPSKPFEVIDINSSPITVPDDGSNHGASGEDTLLKKFAERLITGKKHLWTMISTYQSQSIQRVVMSSLHVQTSRSVYLPEL
jgi:hypothetical protein